MSNNAGTGTDYYINNEPGLAPPSLPSPRAGPRNRSPTPAVRLEAVLSIREEREGVVASLLQVIHLLQLVILSCRRQVAAPCRAPH